VAGEMPDAMSLRVGTPPPAPDPEELLAEAARAAAAADVAVVIVSTSEEVESEGFDRTSLAIPGQQDQLVRRVVAANPRTIVVVNAGSPVLLPWRDEVAAIAAVWFPGQEFGDALAAILSGDEEPGGRLPVTWPTNEHDAPLPSVTPVRGNLEYSEGVHVGYRAWDRGGHEPAYFFGHGLGYTTWNLESLSVEQPTGEFAGLTASVAVRNSGVRRGKAVVQLYLGRHSISSVDRPVRWLAGFACAWVEPGATAVVAVPISSRSFAHWNGVTWTVEPGEWCLHAGLSERDLHAHALVRT
jgi:beta-glucosidase